MPPEDSWGPTRHWPRRRLFGRRWHQPKKITLPTRFETSRQRLNTRGTVDEVGKHGQEPREQPSHEDISSEKSLKDAGLDSASPNSELDLHPPPPKRSRTAPDEGLRRPRLGPRASTLFAATKRRATGSQPNHTTRHQYSYTFDSLPSSDESSSSSDDDPPVSKSKRKRYTGKTKEEADPKQKRDGDSEERAERDAKKKGHSYSKLAIRNGFLDTKGRVSKRDGRLKISINETANSGYMAKALGQSIRNHLNIPKDGKNKNRRARTGSESKDKNDSRQGSDSSVVTNLFFSNLRVNLFLMALRGFFSSPNPAFEP